MCSLTGSILFIIRMITILLLLLTIIIIIIVMVCSFSKSFDPKQLAEVGFELVTL